MPRSRLVAAFVFAAAALAVPAVRAQVGAASRAEPTAPGWNAGALAEVLAYAQGQRTTGLLIIQDRRTVSESNWPLVAHAVTFRNNFVHGTSTDGALLEDVASQQESFVAILVGVAIDKGLLDIAKPVSAYTGVGWSKASPEQESRIVVRNLIEVNSGLRETLAYEAPRDTKFFYNTPAYAVVKPVLEAAARQSLDALTRQWLTEPAGMLDTAWRKRPDAFADVGNPTGLVTTPRNIARMGQLVLDGGEGPQVGDRSSRRPSSMR